MMEPSQLVIALFRVIGRLSVEDVLFTVFCVFCLSNFSTFSFTLDFPILSLQIFVLPHFFYLFLPKIFSLPLPQNARTSTPYLQNLPLLDRCAQIPHPVFHYNFSML